MAIVKSGKSVHYDIRTEQLEIKCNDSQIVTTVGQGLTLMQNMFDDFLSIAGCKLFF
jgi:hypothetical protein